MVLRCIPTDATRLFPPMLSTAEAEAAAKSTAPNPDEAPDKQPPSAAVSQRTTPAPSDASSPEDASDTKEGEGEGGDDAWHAVVLHSQVGAM